MSNRVPPKNTDQRLAWNPLGIELPKVTLPDVGKVIESVTRTVAPVVDAVVKPYEPIVDMYQRAERKNDAAPKSPPKAVTPAVEAPRPKQVLDFIQSADRSIDQSIATPGVRQEVRQQLSRIAERLKKGEVSPEVAAKQASLWSQRLDEDARSQAREGARRAGEIENMSVADKALAGAQGIGSVFLNIGKSAVEVAHTLNGLNPILAVANVASGTVAGSLTTGDVGKSFQRSIGAQVKDTSQAVTNVGKTAQALGTIGKDIDNLNPLSFAGRTVLGALGNGGDLGRATSEALEASKNSGGRLLNLAGDISGVKQILSGDPQEIGAGVANFGLLMTPWATRAPAANIRAPRVELPGQGWRPDPRLPGQSIGRAPAHPNTIDVAATTVAEPGALVSWTKPGALVRSAPAVPPARAREVLAATETQRAALARMLPSKTVSPAHLQQNALFQGDLTQWVKSGRLSPAVADNVSRHLDDLATRSSAYSPANTGNLRDLFNQTLERTKDPTQAFAQVLADSHKIVPLAPQTPLWPAFKNVETGARYTTVGELPIGNPVDTMLAAHTAVAFADPASKARMLDVLRAQNPGLDAAGLDRALARTALGSQHLPSSSFVMARASGLALDVEPLALQAGFSSDQAANMQRFFDVSARFRPEWQPEFKNAGGPRGEDFAAWRQDYRQAYKSLPPELKVQLWTDTLTNFQPGTMESGKWSTAVAKFEGAKTVPDAVEKMAAIVRQYQNEWTVLHGRSLKFFNDVNAPVLKDFGIAIDPRTGFARADLSKLTPQKASLLEQQLAAALGTPPPPPPPPPTADPLGPFRQQADAIVKRAHDLYDVNGEPMQMIFGWGKKPNADDIENDALDYVEEHPGLDYKADLKEHDASHKALDIPPTFEGEARLEGMEDSGLWRIPPKTEELPEDLRGAYEEGYEEGKGTKGAFLRWLHGAD